MNNDNPSGSVALITPALVSADELSFTPVNVWGFIPGPSLSLILIWTGRYVMESGSSPSW